MKVPSPEKNQNLNKSQNPDPPTEVQLGDLTLDLPFFEKTVDFFNFEDKSHFFTFFMEEEFKELLRTAFKEKQKVIRISKLLDELFLHAEDKLDIIKSNRGKAKLFLQKCGTFKNKEDEKGIHLAMHSFFAKLGRPLNEKGGLPLGLRTQAIFVIKRYFDDETYRNRYCNIDEVLKSIKEVADKATAEKDANKGKKVIDYSSIIKECEPEKPKRSIKSII
jgi:hypothetical protein